MCSHNTPNTAHCRQIAVALENWFADHQRDLPWRFPPPSPKENKKTQQKRGYYALVSEAMLQQTQVARVIDYFDKFIQSFPTINDLASAPEQEVLALWQGLGYYRRARNLHAAARIVVNEFHSLVPNNTEQLRKLPGVGPYTAGAIASIGFGQRTPLVDGNVKRVIARLLAYPHSTEQSIGNKLIWQVASNLVNQSTQPGTFNQALMELGSLICLPAGTTARCNTCPIAKHCRAHEQNLVTQIPQPRKPPAQQDLYAASIIIKNSRNHWLLIQRPNQGLWASLYQTPTIESPEKNCTNKTALTKYLNTALGLSVAVGGLNKSHSFLHQTSHRRIHFTVYKLTNYTGRKELGQWVNRKNLPNYPISNAQRKVLGLA